MLWPPNRVRPQLAEASAGEPNKVTVVIETTLYRGIDTQFILGIPNAVRRDAAERRGRLKRAWDACRAGNER